MLYKLRLKQDIKIGALVDQLFEDEKYEPLFKYLFQEYPSLIVTDPSVSTQDLIEHTLDIRRIFKLLNKFKEDGAIAKESLQSLNRNDEEEL